MIIVTKMRGTLVQLVENAGLVFIAQPNFNNGNEIGFATEPVDRQNGNAAV